MQATSSLPNTIEANLILDDDLELLSWFEQLDVYEASQSLCQQHDFGMP